MRFEAVIGRFKQVIGDGLRSRTDRRRPTEMGVAVHALNRMLELGRQISVRIAGSRTELSLLHAHPWSVQQRRVDHNVSTFLEEITFYQMKGSPLTRRRAPNLALDAWLRSGPSCPAASRWSPAGHRCLQAAQALAG